jgi:hypothetical protein
MMTRELKVSRRRRLSDESSAGQSLRTLGCAPGDRFEVGPDSLEEAALVEEFFDDFDEVVARDFDVAVWWGHGS